VVASNGQTVSGTQIVLSATNATFGVGSWIALAGVPAESSLYTNMFTGIASSDDLVTSTILLDDVGRGSNGGDLVVGGLSVGETSGSRGVDRFEITVERTSRLMNIDSTNNWLKEVVVKNGTTKGDLTVLGNFAAHAEFLPGAVAQHDTFGFNDVRLIDGSLLTGRFTFDAAVTAASFAKYMLLTDTQGNPAGDNSSVPGKTTQRADFIYSGGSGNDSINVVVDGGIAASNSTIQSGREDFTFRVNGNNGNDSITFRMSTLRTTVSMVRSATTGTNTSACWPTRPSTPVKATTPCARRARATWSSDWVAAPIRSMSTTAVRKAV